MRNLIILFVLSIFLTTTTFFACKKIGSTTMASADISATYKLEVNKPVPLPLYRELATITLIETSDQRCPVNAVCVTDGPALATIKFKDQYSEQVVQLCMHQCSEGAKTIISNGNTYSMSLVELSPYPGTATSLKIVATVIIQKK